MGKFYEGVAEALTPYVRAVAWWWAVPEAPEKKKRKLSDPKEEAKPVARIKQLREDEEPTLPAYPDEFSHVIGHLFEAGPTSNGAMAPTLLSWADLQAWAALTGHSLEPWEAKLLRNLSAAYLSESQNATSPTAPPPWEPVMTAERRRTVAKHIKQLLRS